MAEFVLAGQGGAFGQGVGQRAEFEGFEQSGQVSADRIGGARVTAVTFGVMAVGVVCVLLRLDAKAFGPFLASFLLLFVANFVLSMIYLQVVPPKGG